MDVSPYEIQTNYDKLFEQFILAKQGVCQEPSQQVTQEVTQICEFCEKTFHHKNSYYRHKKHYCKSKDKDLDDKDKELDNKDKLINSLVEMLKEKGVETKILNNSVIGNNNENCCNTNITINGFGKEDLSMITDKVMNDLVHTVETAINEMFKMIHLETPENMNLILPSVNNQFMKVYNDETDTWEMKNTNKVFDTITVRYGDMIYEYVKSNKKDVKKSRNVGRLENYIESVTDEYADNRKKSDIRNTMKVDLVNKQEYIKTNV